MLQCKQERGEEVIDLTLSNPTRAEIRYPEDEIKEALFSSWTPSYNPDPLGLLEAREAVARYYADRSCQVDPSDVLLTSSTSEAYAFLFNLLANPGDPVMVPQPSYPLFEFLAAMESLRLAPYGLRLDERWTVDLDDFREQFRGDPRAVLVVSPNNPTGSFISRADWEEVRRLCFHQDIPVICDEVFFEYPLRSSAPRFDPITDSDFPCFFLNGLSKTAGLPQLKLSWIVIRGPEDFREGVRPRLELISDTYLSVQTSIQKALGPILELAPQVRSQILKRILGNLSTLESMIPGTPVTCLPCEGGWNAVLRVPRTLNEEEWVLALLERANVLVHPGYFYDFPAEGFLIISLLPTYDDFKNGLERMLALISSRR